MIRKYWDKFKDSLDYHLSYIFIMCLVFYALDTFSLVQIPHPIKVFTAFYVAFFIIKYLLLGMRF